MNSLWTPSGEHEVPKEKPEESGDTNTGMAGAGNAGSPSQADGSGSTDASTISDPAELSPEEREAMAQQFEETRRQIAETPAEQIITTHIIGLYELAVIHLRNEPPNLNNAKLAIDAMTAIVTAVGESLGEYGEAMRNALNEIQMAFVAVSQGDATTNGTATGSGDSSQTTEEEMSDDKGSDTNGDIPNDEDGNTSS